MRHCVGTDEDAAAVDRLAAFEVKKTSLINAIAIKCLTGESHQTIMKIQNATFKLNSFRIYVQKIR